MNEQDNNNQATLPRRSRRLATIIPASHWVSMGYSQDDAELMEKLQNDMKKYCDRSGDIDIALRGRGGGTLPYHDLILPHWKKLLKALKGRTNVEFQVTGISLPSPLLDIVFPALQEYKIVQLRLIGTGLVGGGFQCLSSFLEKNSSLTSLGIGADRLDDLSVAGALSDAIKNHPTLEDLFIARCIGHNASILEKILQGCTTKRVLMISMENFGLYGSLVDVVADFISSNHTVEKLHLIENNIADNDAKLLASALKTNRHLKLLDLVDNYDITDEGEKALLNVLYDPTTMDSVIESNHLCMVNTDNNDNIVALEQRPLLEQEVLKINKGDLIANTIGTAIIPSYYSIQQKIRQKVVLALCGVDGELFDLSYLNNLPLGVMPRVLELIQEHTAIRRSKNTPWGSYQTPVQLKKDALTRLFHTLRGWELPLLFENLHNPSSNGTTGKRKRRKTRR